MLVAIGAGCGSDSAPSWKLEEPRYANGSDPAETLAIAREWLASVKGSVERPDLPGEARRAFAPLREKIARLEKRIEEFQRGPAGRWPKFKEELRRELQKIDEEYRFASRQLQPEKKNT